MATEPGVASRPMSLRIRSTIIRFSESVFGSRASARTMFASSAGVAPRAAVPFIGFDESVVPSFRRKSSGESDRMRASGKDRYAPNSTDCFARSAR